MPYKPASGMDGHPVDRKPFNWHMSAQPGANSVAHPNNTAGVTVWSDLSKYPAGSIPAGAIVQEHRTEPGKIEVADGAEFRLGITYYTRMAGDERYQSYTIDGVVEMIAGTGGIPTVGAYIKADTVANYWGTAVVGAAADGVSFGRALTVATNPGDRFWAYVDFKQ